VTIDEEIRILAGAILDIVHLGQTDPDTITQIEAIFKGEV